MVSIGKIADIYAHTGITKKIKATGIEELFDASLEEIKLAGDNTIVFTNFVDFDSSFGHRRDVSGYAKALEKSETFADIGQTIADYFELSAMDYGKSLLPLIIK